jgi:acyl-coenzyme A synthetase/AMP-(fatty) acid ligase
MRLKTVRHFNTMFRKCLTFEDHVTPPGKQLSSKMSVNFAKTITFGELKSKTEQLAAGLSGEVKKGDFTGLCRLRICVGQGRRHLDSFPCERQDR